MAGTQVHVQCKQAAYSVGCVSCSFSLLRAGFVVAALAAALRYNPRSTPGGGGGAHPHGSSDRASFGPFFFVFKFRFVASLVVFVKGAPEIAPPPDTGCLFSSNSARGVVFEHHPSPLTHSALPAKVESHGRRSLRLLPPPALRCFLVPPRQLLCPPPLIPLSFVRFFLFAVPYMQARSGAGSSRWRRRSYCPSRRGPTSRPSVCSTPGTRRPTAFTGSRPAQTKVTWQVLELMSQRC